MLASGLCEDLLILLCHFLTFFNFWLRVTLTSCFKNWKSAFENKIFFKARNGFLLILISIIGVKMKSRIITKNIKSIQQCIFRKDRFYDVWSSQRPPVSVRVHKLLICDRKNFVFFSNPMKTDSGIKNLYGDIGF